MNDLDPMLTEAMARVQHPTGARPSITDVRRRARRHNRRRMTATVGAVACTGVATAALIIRRDSAEENTRFLTSGEPENTAVPIGTYSPTTMYIGGPGATTTVPMMSQQTIDAALVWRALASMQGDPSAAGLTYPTDHADDAVMPTAEMFGCASAECGAMFNYIVWNRIAVALGFFDVWQMQSMNSGIDFSQLPLAGDVLQSVVSSYMDPAFDPNSVPPTTISVFDGIVLIDGGAPQGAMEDAYQRLNGYNRTIVPSSGKTVEQTMVMPVLGGDNTPVAGSMLSLFGVGGFDPWDPSLVSAPVEGMVAVVIGPDYFDRVGGTASVAPTIDTTSTSLWPTTTAVGP